jgi:HK97 family phage prohead protease
MEPDFSGWATKANLKCSDGRTITSEAFKHMDGARVPLVWQHVHNDPSNILGYGILKHNDEGVRIDGYFNNTSKAKEAKELVKHGDIRHLSIYANDLVEKNKVVMHGNIRETSLVLAGANKGAVIDRVNIRHSDGSVEELDDEVIIFTGLELSLAHAEDGDGDGGTDNKGDDAPGDATEQSLADIWESLTPEQQLLVNYAVGEAYENGKNENAGSEIDAAHSDDNKTTDSGEGDLSHQEGDTQVTRNVFDRTGKSKEVTTTASGGELKHAEDLPPEFKKDMFAAALKIGSLKQAFEDTCIRHGITPMDVLFPEFKALESTPQFNSRRMEWVTPFLNQLSHSPFSRVKSIVADITMDEARARGYVKGNIKREEWFTVSKRYTTPTTVYKKQQFDRDDMLDITDFDMIAWVKAEMDMMLREEIARAILVGDGRDVADVDKIKDPGAANSGEGLRAIVNEHELYKTDVNVNLTSTPNWELVVDSVLGAMRYYKGSGMPTFYTTYSTMTNMLLIKDGFQRRLYPTKADLASAMGVADIVPVEAMESGPANLIGVIVNPGDYNVGADRGGEVTLFDFFDIDYNQYKYLTETRISGALTKVKSALAIWQVPSTDTAVTPVAPTFNTSTGVVTIPSETGIVYKDGNGNTLTAGAQTAIDPDTSITIVATPASGYYFPISATQTSFWMFSRPNPDGEHSNP